MKFISKYLLHKGQLDKLDMTINAMKKDLGIEEDCKDNKT